MMVSGPRTPVRAPIGGGMLLFPAFGDGTDGPAGIRLAPVPDHGLSWSTPRGGAMGHPAGSITRGPGYDVLVFARGSGGMADAHGSGPCARKGVRVQLPSSPPHRSLSL